ncbi:30S ribosomal protein S14 [endosymbiont GvMRE of Glomus versiforme]|uniref:30S ribosomal protein S14 n=1 Tax=endosymbiont GvMRE of Glomus versiforme TaxID=2039283 RepID=UPI000EE8F9E3|nr:30S ribosomal protein S14 [endosymbiont GvMRE of Glomus versiforme]RHZ35304.1 30S ribosomal protein S14 type Z [endosymbiont GvMRE of Glomus versiforme]
MPKKCLIVKAGKTPKFSTRRYKICIECGRSRAVFSWFLLCRIDLREYFYGGRVPGYKKVSW